MSVNFPANLRRVSKFPALILVGLVVFTLVVLRESFISRMDETQDSVAVQTAEADQPTRSKLPQIKRNLEAEEPPRYQNAPPKFDAQGKPTREVYPVSAHSYEGDGIGLQTGIDEIENALKQQAAEFQQRLTGQDQAYALRIDELERSLELEKAKRESEIRNAPPRIELSKGVANKNNEPTLQNASFKRFRDSGPDRFNHTPEDPWLLSDRRSHRDSKYTVMAGEVIPARLLNDVNSELCGPMRAEVIQSVYDTRTKQHLLIPHGTKIFAECPANLTVGSTRVQPVARRLVFPDASFLNLPESPIADANGVTGLTGKVNRRYGEILGFSFVLGLLNGGFEATQERIDGWNNGAERVGDRVSSELHSTASKLIEQRIDLAPRVTMKKGTEIYIVVNKDMEFEEPYYAN